MNWIPEWFQKRQQDNRERREAREAIQGLIENSQLTEKFIVMSILSGIVATCGIVLRDTSILIAAMVLAPLLNPLLAMGAGIVLRHGGLVRFSLKAFLGGFTAVIITTSLLTFGLRIGGIPIQPELFLERFNDNHTLPVLLVVAFFSGFGAVYAWLKHSSSANFVAVAIAVALIPFVSLYGVLIGTQKWALLGHLSLILFSNLFVITLGAVTAFMALGVKIKAEEVDQELEG